MARFALSLILLTLAGCGHRSHPDQAIFILLDAARPDRFSCYGYERETTPNLDRLAADGALFGNNFVQATHTREVLPTLLYSRYFTVPIFPHSASVPLTDPAMLFRRPDRERVSLPRALEAAGFVTGAISAHEWLKEGTRFAEEFGELHDLVTILDTKGAYPPAEAVVDYAIDWIEEHLDRSYFLYIHLMDTHFPHDYGPDAQEFFGAGEAPRAAFDFNGRPRNVKSELSPVERRYLDALYDGSLRAADREIGRLLEFLGERGRLRTTLVVVTADHGEHLLEVPGRFAHGGEWLDPVGRTPLIISCPKAIHPRRIDTYTEGVDIAPTVLALLGVEPPAGTRADGLALLGDGRASPPARPFAFAATGIRSKNHKCLFAEPDRVLAGADPPPAESLAGRLFDLRADPDETDDVWGENPETVETLTAAFREHLGPSYRRFVAATRDEPPEAAFAIGSNHFRIEPEVSSISVDDPGETGPGGPRGRGEPGWTRRVGFRRFALTAEAGAGPVTIEIPVPSGDYLVSATLTGRARLEVEGTPAPVILDGGSWRQARGGAAEVGRVAVRGGTFRASLRPEADRGFSLQRFGFIPIGEGETAPGPDSEREERLRALGYID